MWEQLKAVLAKLDEGKNAENKIFTESVETEISTLFEAAVNEKVNEKLQEAVSAEKVLLQEAAKTEVEDFKTQLVESIDKYLDLAADEYMDSNKIALEGGIETELKTKLVEGFVEVLSKNGITVEKPVESDTLLEGYKGDIETLKHQVNRLVEENKTLSDNVIAERALNAFESVTVTLSEGEKAKVRMLAEDLVVDDVDEFKTKLSIIVESMTKKEEVQSLVDIDKPEVFVEGEDLNKDKKDELHPDVARFMEFM